MTGVQTCALPISRPHPDVSRSPAQRDHRRRGNAWAPSPARSSAARGCDPRARAPRGPLAPARRSSSRPREDCPSTGEGGPRGPAVPTNLQRHRRHRPAATARPGSSFVRRKSEQPASLEAGCSKRPRQRPTLPQSCPCSTIGPGELNFRVRDGNGCDPSAVATEICCQLTSGWPRLRGRRPLEDFIASTNVL